MQWATGPRQRDGRRAGANQRPMARSLAGVIGSRYVPALGAALGSLALSTPLLSTHAVSEPIGKRCFLSSKRFCFDRIRCRSMSGHVLELNAVEDRRALFPFCSGDAESVATPSRVSAELRERACAPVRIWASPTLLGPLGAGHHYHFRSPPPRTVASASWLEPPYAADFGNAARGEVQLTPTAERSSACNG
jgi:hypothetical protein